MGTLCGEGAIDSVDGPVLAIAYPVPRRSSGVDEALLNNSTIYLAIAGGIRSPADALSSFNKGDFIGNG
jgi:hypothetical protein